MNKAMHKEIHIVVQSQMAFMEAKSGLRPINAQQSPKSGAGAEDVQKDTSFGTPLRGEQWGVKRAKRGKMHKVGEGFEME